MNPTYHFLVTAFSLAICVSAEASVCTSTLSPPTDAHRPRYLPHLFMSPQPIRVTEEPVASPQVPEYGKRTTRIQHACHAPCEMGLPAAKEEITSTPPGKPPKYPTRPPGQGVPNQEAHRRKKNGPPPRGNEPKMGAPKYTRSHRSIPTN